MIKAVPNSGNMINFCQFLFIALEGLIFHSRFFTRERKIPLKNYICMVVLFFSSSITNMMALDCDIPMPLHMIFKSGSLVANMLMGYLVLDRRYSKSKIISVLLVSVGICISTLASQQQQSDEVINYTMTWQRTKGIALMLTSLVLSARLGVYQENVFIEFGKHTREAAFYNHIIPLPLYALMAPSIKQSFVSFTPATFNYLAVNLLTQYACIRSVFRLSAQISSLSLTLLVTLRKFISLVLSVVYFGNHFTAAHSAGAACVLLGSLVYADLIAIPLISAGKKTEKVE